MKTFFGLVIVATASVAHAQSAVSSNAFNPALSVILDGKYAHYSLDPARYGISGFLLGSDAGLAPRGFSLGESEIAASANVDDRFYGQLTTALHADGDKTDVSVEEAFIQTTALPSGFTLKFGRFFSDIGYLNSKHAHAWDFVDQPLAYKAMLNMQYGDDGVQARWVAPTDLLVELGAEAFRGAQFPAANATHGGVGAWSAFAHAGGDIGNEQSWRAGVSYLNADSTQRESALPTGDRLLFDGSDRLWIADFVWKWAEHGNPKTRNIVVQGEYLRRQESGAVSDTSVTSNYSGTQQGFYLQAVWQFMPRWRVGLRYDKLNASNRAPALGIMTPLSDTHSPNRTTAMVDFSNSEFSRLRLQLAEDKSQPQSDTQLTFQYVMSIGAHGAHQF
ncbi:MAG TPA: TonB-dependent receptor [Steroidobacteraceae bacterium]|nr:TonB-dependent receptor [Steroidobacteraceae bacterium]